MNTGHNGHTPLTEYLRETFLPECGTANTHHQHKSAVSRLRCFLGREPEVGEIDDALVEKFADWLSTQPLSDTSKRLYRASLRTIARHANPALCPKIINDESLSLPGSLMRFFREVYRPRTPGITDGAIQQHLIALRQFCRFLGRAAMLSDLTDETVAAFMQHLLDRGFSRATANSNRGCVLADWRLAYRLSKKQPVRKRLVRESPDVPKLREHRRLPRAWTIDEMQRLLTAAAATPGMVGEIPAGRWWTAVLLTLYDTGLRRNAAMLTERRDVDLDSRWLTARAETQKQRNEQQFRLSDQTVEAIRLIWLPPRRELFPWPWAKRLLYDKYTRILVSAGLPCGRKDKFHKIRKTTASHIAKAAGVSVASMVLGHSDVQVSKRYIDASIANTQIDATAYLPRLSFGGNRRK